MKSQGYYRLFEPFGCDLAVDDHYLVVNCTGVYALNQPFVSDNRIGRQDFYLMYLYRGELDICVSGVPRKLRKGDMTIYPAGLPYRYSKNSEGEMAYFWAHFTGYGVSELLKSCGLWPGMVGSPGCEEELAADFQRLFRCFYTRERFFEVEAAGQLTNILTRMARAMGEDGAALPGALADRIRISLDYLYRNYAENIALAQLAEIEHLSPSRYSAVFRQCMGVSPQGFLISLRMKNAADLLRRTNLSIKQVARAIGYEDPLYFSSLFKKKIGISPLRYQREGSGTLDAFLDKK